MVSQHSGFLQILISCGVAVDYILLQALNMPCRSCLLKLLLAFSFFPGSFVVIPDQFSDGMPCP